MLIIQVSLPRYFYSPQIHDSYTLTLTDVRLFIHFNLQLCCYEDDFLQENMLTLVTDLHKLFVDNDHNETDEELADHAFQEMDVDENGLVTREEFVEAVMSREHFSYYLAQKIFNLFGWNPLTTFV